MTISNETFEYFRKKEKLRLEKIKALKNKLKVLKKK